MSNKILLVTTAEKGKDRQFIETLNFHAQEKGCVMEVMIHDKNPKVLIDYLKIYLVDTHAFGGLLIEAGEELLRNEIFLGVIKAAVKLGVHVVEVDFGDELKFKAQSLIAPHCIASLSGKGPGVYYNGMDGLTKAMVDSALAESAVHV